MKGLVLLTRRETFAARTLSRRLHALRMAILQALVSWGIMRLGPSSGAVIRVSRDEVTHPYRNMPLHVRSRGHNSRLIATLFAVFPPELPQGAWSNMNFAFAFINPDSFAVIPMDERDVSLYTQFTGLKKNNTGLETWISVGGWSMNDPGPYQTTFSDLAASVEAQDAFAKSLVDFMEKYGFDGVDIDWVR